jgi:hypothetical protein
MKKPIIKIFDKTIVLLLFFLGIFSSCHKDESDNVAPKYGVPEPMYGVMVPYNGKNNSIINQETTNSTQNIQLIGEFDMKDGNALLI